MSTSRKAVLLTLSLNFLITLLPASAQQMEATTIKPQSQDEASFYDFKAELLDYPSGIVAARFELRERHRLLDSEEVQLNFDGADSLLLEIPFSLDKLPAAIDAQILVFAGDVLLEVFDRDSLQSHNRTLANTHPELRAAFTDGGSNYAGCYSPCGGGCLPSEDFDCDGVSNANDNCTDNPNPSQADCDNDGRGDVCDGTNGSYLPAGDRRTCKTDKDRYHARKTFEHHAEKPWSDRSSCNSPDRWTRTVLDRKDCGLDLSNEQCCLRLRTSIQILGDSPSLWCGSSRRDRNYCH